MITKPRSILQKIAGIDNKILRYELAQKITGDVNDTFYDERISILKLAKEAYMDDYIK